MTSCFSWTDDKKPLRTTYSTPLLTVTTIIIVVSQVSSFVRKTYFIFFPLLQPARPWPANGRLGLAGSMPEYSIGSIYFRAPLDLASLGNISIGYNLEWVPFGRHISGGLILVGSPIQTNWSIEAVFDDLPNKTCSDFWIPFRSGAKQGHTRISYVCRCVDFQNYCIYWWYDPDNNLIVTWQ